MAQDFLSDFDFGSLRPNEIMFNILGHGICIIIIEFSKNQNQVVHVKLSFSFPQKLIKLLKKKNLILILSYNKQRKRRRC